MNTILQTQIFCFPQKWLHSTLCSAFPSRSASNASACLRVDCYLTKVQRPRHVICSWTCKPSRSSLQIEEVPKSGTSEVSSLSLTKRSSSSSSLLDAPSIWNANYVFNNVDLSACSFTPLRGLGKNKKNPTHITNASAKTVTEKTKASRINT